MKKSLDTGLRLDGTTALDLWESMIKCFIPHKPYQQNERSEVALQLVAEHYSTWKNKSNKARQSGYEKC